MGNSSTKESRPGTSRRPSSLRNLANGDTSSGPQSPQSPGDRLVGNLYSSRAGRSSRPDLSFLHIGNSERETPTPDVRRETKQERDARKAEKERKVREQEREKSLREESVDGGYLVTLGTYTGAEDFNKTVVRQLQIDRRLAPFWKGLNDHSDSWVEHQLVAAVRGLPIPAADEIPLGIKRTTSQVSNDQRIPENSINNLTVPITSRSHSQQSDPSANLSASHPAFSTAGTFPPIAPVSGSMPLFRGRAKTLASLTTSKSSSAANIAPREAKLPKDPFVNGQAIEAYLYKDASECPICFLYYPPYLNKTRCCDQPICSECFVQIKRPDPHPPEHHDDPSNPPAQPTAPGEEGLLVSEASSCPFCVTPEFGVTYEPPAFRRGLTHMGQGSGHPLAAATSAMSSSSSLGSGTSRRRATSLSANAPSVITTDKVRPDWAKKLSDARSHALRRSVAATALHNAAYVLGNVQGGEGRGFALGRRRRTFFGDVSGSGSGTSHMSEGTSSGLGTLLAQTDGQDGGTDLYSNRTSSRRTRVDDIEELMMMEAIRLSLAAEDDRKRREEKDAKKDGKKRAKEAKKAEKAAKKADKAVGLYPSSTNESTSTWATTSMARSTSNLGFQPNASTSQLQGKGKAPASGPGGIGFNPLSEPTSTLNTEMSQPSQARPSTADDPQKHLEESRANIPSQPVAVPGAGTESHLHARHVSNASSAASSMIESGPASLRQESGFTTPPNASGVDISNPGTPASGSVPSHESMFNFRSLAAMVGQEGKSDGEVTRVEHADPAPEPERLYNGTKPVDGNRSRGDSGESSSSGPPPVYVEATDGSISHADGDVHEDDSQHDQITPVPARNGVEDKDSKYFGDVSVVHTHREGNGRITQ